MHIQKFVDNDEDDFGNRLPPGNFRPVKDVDESGGAKLYFQAGSKMNDEEFDEDAPF